MPWNENLEANSPAYEFASIDSEVIKSLAGPGTGKSFALKRRIARLLEEGVDPKKILAVTFTRTAASDLKSEISSLNIDGAEKVHAKTLHSLCFTILNRNDVFNVTQRNTRVMLDYEITPLMRDLDNNVFGNMRKKRERINAYEAAWARLQHDDPGYSFDEQDSLFEDDLLKWLKYHKSMLIGELVPLTYRYLKENPECLELDLFDYVFVDEYQDFNKAEQELIMLLKSNGNIAIIGDDDQSIYSSLKYAHPEGIREFDNRFTICKTIDFIECRRCPTKVVEMASSLISKNNNRSHDKLLPRGENDVGNINILQWRTLDEEVEGIAKIIKYNLNKNNVNPNDILVLTPRRLIGYKIRDCLNSKEIPVKSYFREEALDNDEARKLFSLLYLTVFPEDRVSYRYLLGYGSQDFRKNAYKRLWNYAKKHDLEIYNVLDKLIEGNINISYSKYIVDKYKKIKTDLEDIKYSIDNNADSLIDSLVPEGENKLEGLREVLLNSKERIDNLESYNSPYDWWSSLFEEAIKIITNVNSPDFNVNHVRVMSLHSSKGLNAKFVILAGCIEELIPLIDRNQSDLQQEKALEEQRRLFYVAITRCKNEPGEYEGTLILSSFLYLDGQEAVKMNIPAKVGKPRKVSASRFITELGSTKPTTERGNVYLFRLE